MTLKIIKIGIIMRFLSINPFCDLRIYFYILVEAICDGVNNAKKTTEAVVWSVDNNPHLNSVGDFVHHHHDHHPVWLYPRRSLHVLSVYSSRMKNTGVQFSFLICL